MKAVTWGRKVTNLGNKINVITALCQPLRWWDFSALFCSSYGKVHVIYIYIKYIFNHSSMLLALGLHQNELGL